MSEYVCVVVDTDASAWSRSSTSNLVQVAEAVSVFASSVRASHRESRVVLVAAGGTTAAVVPEPRRLLEYRRESNDKEEETNLARALGVSLCRINKDFSTSETTAAPASARILLVTATALPPRHFVRGMNCAFGATRSGILIDVLDCSAMTDDDAHQLIHLSHLTNGLYVKAPPQEPLLAPLLTHFTRDAATRRLTSGVPIMPSINTRAVCFCHEKPVSIGYVCSVCLAVYCDEGPVPTTCGACRMRVMPTTSRA